jgi:hypothetical protein
MRKAKLLAVLLLAGCAEHHEVRPLRSLEIPLVPYQGIAATVLTGSLMYEHGCLLFRDDASPVILMPIWPVGSSFNGTSVLFHEPAKADQRIVVTEQFQMAGRALQWSALDPGYYAPYRSQCPGQPFLVSFVQPAN